jgi:hypothetical protein
MPARPGGLAPPVLLPRRVARSGARPPGRLASRPAAVGAGSRGVGGLAGIRTGSGGTG